MKNLSLKKWDKALKDEQEAVILDVRTEDEYQLEHVPGAQQINVNDPKNFMDKIKKLDKNKKYFVYCNSGNRSIQACQVLDFNGFQHTFSLIGGYKSWKDHHASTLS